MDESQFLNESEYRNKILVGDARKRLQELPSSVFQCVITSPPYYSLRNYDELEPCDPGASSLLSEAKAFPPIGIEDTIDEYIESVMEVCREVKRVLRKDGIFFFNIADTYSGKLSSQSYINKNFTKEFVNAAGKTSQASKKSLMIPQRFGVAFFNEGWYVRNTIIWRKTSCSPEKVYDRFNVNFEYVYILTKGPDYFSDIDAVREPLKKSSLRTYEKAYPKAGRSEVNSKNYLGSVGKAVWDIASSTSSFFHIATFPVELVERCMRFGMPGKCCLECRRGYERIFDLSEAEVEYLKAHWEGNGDNKIHKRHVSDYFCRGYEKKCNCDEVKTISSIVMDPFFGSGTVGLVALNREYAFTGIEVSKEYANKAKWRLKRNSPLFTSDIELCERSVVT